MYHGHGGRKEEVDLDSLRFFKIIDEMVLEHHSKPSGLPLLLAALPEHHHLFHTISHNPFLMKTSLNVHPDALSMTELREKSWALIKPNYLNRLNQLIEKYHHAKAKALGSDELDKIGKAALEGRLSTLLVAADSQIGGRLNGETGEIQPNDLQHPNINDLLDDLAELTLKTGGEVVIVPNECMPSDTGAASIYRF